KAGDRTMYYIVPSPAFTVGVSILNFPISRTGETVNVTPSEDYIHRT
ncbi:25135_t:CDS:1, partial [Dentiscutata erythropus]